LLQRLLQQKNIYRYGSTIQRSMSHDNEKSTQTYFASPDASITEQVNKNLKGNIVEFV
jgi:hypothetical protein